MRSRGQQDSGFTLLEALLAAAALALIAIPTMGAFGRALEQNQPRVAVFEAHEFAVSLLEQRAATRDFREETGIYGDRFAFQVTSEPFPNLEKTRYDNLIHFTRLSVQVSDVGQRAQPASVSQVFAHRPRP